MNDELTPIQKSLVRSLLIAKSDAKKETETLIDEFLQTTTKSAAKQTREFLSDLMVFVMRSDIPKDELLPIVEAKINALGYNIPAAALDTIYQKTAETAAKEMTTITSARAPVSFVFNRADTASIAVMKEQFVWIKQDFTDTVQGAIKAGVEKVFQGKLNEQELGDALRETFAGVVFLADARWDIAADTLVRRSQQLARINQASQYDTPYMKIKARIDNKTSEICRSMNGRIVPIKHLQKQAQKIQNAQSIDEAIKAAPWQTVPFIGATSDLPANLGLPPYHPHCRTIAMPFWGDEGTEIDGKTATGSIKAGEAYKGYDSAGNPKSKTVEFSHIDSLGVERVVTQDTYGHVEDRTGEKPTYAKLIAALNSIENVSEQANGNVIAQAKNGVVLIYEGSEVWTAIEPTIGAKEYFKRNAHKSTEKVKKWKSDQWLSKLTGIGSLLSKMLNRAK
ncbi:hypothetical protein FACS1894103_4020 [Campylobacterota bacterium]|nr:hypothetical protein FACS1894103_4020 [Campylobacterota bacterium]